MTTNDEAVTLSRRLKASPVELFNAWIDPARFAQWMRDDEYQVSVVEIDARPGGSYRFDVTGPEDEVHSTSGIYRELVHGERLVKTWKYDGPHPGGDRGESLLTVTFHEIEPGVTEMTLQHDRVATEAGRETLRVGWTGCLEKFEELYG